MRLRSAALAEVVDENETPKASRKVLEHDILLDEATLREDDSPSYLTEPEQHWFDSRQHAHHDNMEQNARLTPTQGQGRLTREELHRLAQKPLDGSGPDEGGNDKSDYQDILEDHGCSNAQASPDDNAASDDQGASADGHGASGERTASGKRREIEYSSHPKNAIVPPIQKPLDEILENGCWLDEFVRAQIPTCPIAYDSSAMMSTKSISGADFSLCGTKQELKMLVHDENFMNTSARRFADLAKGISLHSPDPWTKAQIGNYHPDFTKEHQSMKIFSEADTVTLVRHILTRPALYSVQIVTRFLEEGLEKVQEGEIATESLRRLVEDPNAKVEYVINSSEPIPVKPGPNKQGTNNDNFRSAPDLCGLRLEYRIMEPIDEEGDHIRELKGARRFLVVEVKTQNALSLLLKLVTLVQERGKAKYRCTAFRWPGVGFPLSDKTDKLLCQVRSFPIVHDNTRLIISSRSLLR